MGDPTDKDKSKECYDGWMGWAHPGAPSGGGGPAANQCPGPLGAEPWYVPGMEHPFSPLGLAQPGTPAKSEPVPLALDLIAEDIGGYSKDELNAALKTTFGEISAQIHGDLQKEANAVASTIFNRLQKINDARAKFNEVKPRLDPAKKAEDKAKNEYEDLANHPSKYKAELKGEYDKKLKEAKSAYNAALAARGKLEKALNEANSAKTSAETYVLPAKRDAQKLTLADIVEPAGQYEGTATGNEYFNDFPRMHRANQERNLARWNTAKQTVENLAKNPESRDKYIEFRSSRDPATNKLKPLLPGRTRVGGNDFW